MIKVWSGIITLIGLDETELWELFVSLPADRSEWNYLPDEEDDVKPDAIVGG